MKLVGRSAIRRFVVSLMGLTASSIAVAQSVVVAQDPADLGGSYQGDAIQFAPFMHRVEIAPTDAGLPSTIERLPEVPSNFLPWWHLPVKESVFTEFQPNPVGVESLLMDAISHSVQVRAYATEPMIEETRIDEALAAFDWTAFVESKWNRASEPVGSTLTVGGGRTRSRTGNATTEAGIRRRNTFGGELSLAQQFGFQTSNSSFFTPTNQGSGRMTLSYTQPLLRGTGRTYNRSQIVIAQIGTDAANERYLDRLQSYLYDVTDAYWNLYRSRALLLQRRKLFESAQVIVEQMRRRSSVDSTADQLIRAEAAATKRLTDLIRSETDVIDAQDRLRNLINSPDLEADWRMEFLPQDAPTHDVVPVDLQRSMAIALDYRPEVLASLQDIKAASVEKFVTEAELLPRLDLVLETYASGLRGEFDAGGAFMDQFTTGEPSYTVGLNYEMPLGNRAAVARDRRKQLEVARLEWQFRTVVERVSLEVRTAVRNLDTLGREMRARYEALEKAKDEVIYIENRMRLLPSVNKTASLYLENLLTSQERLAGAEAEYLESQISYSLAQIKLKQVTGTLLQYDEISLEMDAMLDTGSIETEPSVDEESGPRAPFPADRLEGTGELFGDELPNVEDDDAETGDAWPGNGTIENLPIFPPQTEPMLLIPGVEVPELIPLDPMNTPETGTDEAPLIPIEIPNETPVETPPKIEPLPSLLDLEPTPFDGAPSPGRPAPSDLDTRTWRNPAQRMTGRPTRQIWE